MIIFLSFFDKKNTSWHETKELPQKIRIFVGLFSCYLNLSLETVWLTYLSMKSTYISYWLRLVLTLGIFYFSETEIILIFFNKLFSKLSMTQVNTKQTDALENLASLSGLLSKVKQEGSFSFIWAKKEIDNTDMGGLAALGGA